MFWIESSCLSWHVYHAIFSWHVYHACLSWHVYLACLSWHAYLLMLILLPSVPCQCQASALFSACQCQVQCMPVSCSVLASALFSGDLASLSSPVACVEVKVPFLEASNSPHLPLSSPTCFGVLGVLTQFSK